MIKIFNLKLKDHDLDLNDDDPLALDLDTRAIMHDVEATRFKNGIPLTTFVKVLYPTYSYYLESLQASSQLKDITFDIIVEKFATCEKDFVKTKKNSQSPKEELFSEQLRE